LWRYGVMIDYHRLARLSDDLQRQSAYAKIYKLVLETFHRHIGFNSISSSPPPSAVLSRPSLPFCQHEVGEKWHLLLVRFEDLCETQKEDCLRICWKTAMAR